VADRLGRLVVVDAELPRHLRALRAYLLLGRGDFYQCFLEEARALLAAPPRASTAEADLAVPFAQAASKSSAADDAQKLARRFRLRLGSPYGAGRGGRGGGTGFRKKRTVRAAASRRTTPGTA
jgi:gamma-tubulin complex component 4